MQKVTFNAAGHHLAGHLYFPPSFDDTKTYPAVLVGGSLTSVKEQMAGTYAQELAQRGFIALAFDYRNYGESEGQPRQYEDPQLKLEDLQAAVTFLGNQPYVSSISALGICTSAGNMAYLAAEDHRVQALATVAGWFPNQAVLPLLYGSAENVAALRQTGQAAKATYANTGAVQTVLAYSDTDATASHVGPMEYYMDAQRGGGVPEWRNQFAVMSWETWLDFAPIDQAANIHIPTAVLHSDGCALPDNAKAFYHQLQGPKTLLWLEGNHFDFYDQPTQVTQASDRIATFFQQNLK